MKELKNKILGLLQYIDRDGIDDLVEYLKESDYFTAPASKNNHLNTPGGLMKHSFNVYTIMKIKNEKYDLDIHPNSIVIVGLLHDLCKTGFYSTKLEMTKKQNNFITDLLEGINEYKVIKNIEGLMDDVKEDKGYIPREYASDLISFILDKDYKKDEFKYPQIEDSEKEDAVKYAIDNKLPLGHSEKSLYLINKFIDLTDEEALAIRWHMEAFDKSFIPDGYNNDFRDACDHSPLINLVQISDKEATFYEKWKRE